MKDIKMDEIKSKQSEKQSSENKHFINYKHPTYTKFMWWLIQIDYFDKVQTKVWPYAVWSLMPIFVIPSLYLTIQTSKVPIAAISGLFIIEYRQYWVPIRFWIDNAAAQNLLQVY